MERENSASILLRRCDINGRQNDASVSVVTIPPVTMLLIDVSAIVVKALIYTGVLGGIMMVMVAVPMQLGPRNLPGRETQEVPTISEEMLDELSKAPPAPRQLPGPSNIRLVP